VEATTDQEHPDGPAPAPAPRPRARFLALAIGVSLGVAYVVLGLPGDGFPGRAGIAELHRVETEINRSYAECGVDRRASIDWWWGTVRVPGNGIVGDLPADVRLSRDELGHATGTRNFFWLVCPVGPSAGG